MVVAQNDFAYSSFDILKIFLLYKALFAFQCSQSTLQCINFNTNHTR